MSRPQATLTSPVEAEGVGLHSGARVRARILPAPPEHGLRFVRLDLPDSPEVPALAAHVRSSQLATTLGCGPCSAATTEHLLAALYGLRIDNARIELSGPEVPALDGSAAPWTRLLQGAGRLSQDRPSRAIRLLRRVEVHQGDRMIALEPSERLSLAVHIDFAHEAIGAQSIDLELDPDSFLRELAWARTFGFTAELDALRTAGLARGGSLENAVVFGDEGQVLNTEGLRAPDEPVRHKALDLVGDLALLGAELQARVSAVRPGHALSLALMQALLADPSAWTRSV